jgi:hypothetical protein
VIVSKPEFIPEKKIAYIISQIRHHTVLCDSVLQKTHRKHGQKIEPKRGPGIDFLMEK